MSPLMVFCFTLMNLPILFQETRMEMEWASHQRADDRD
ncbi:hypothetical protein BSU04_32835 [Caballeronia sordidicola]|uniref:Uncharacterized protein n=1 Tax=Caballeronia sordidicola TaxID=196367 RepID=A0A226WSV4_CABSO|nr:hypothetical protein BSU04_32835 [Caballeronia sordidicola]